MTGRFLSSVALAGLVGFGTHAQSQDTPSVDTVIATVGETEITLGHMLALRGGLPEQYDQIAPNVLFEAVLDQLVQQSLLMQTHEGELSREARMRLENERRAILAAEVTRDIFDTEISDAEIRALYEARYAGESGKTEYRAAHILLETEEAALDVIEDIEGGANFAALAQEHSVGPSGPSGGDLGWFEDGVMIPEFFDAVTELDEGEVSAPVETQFGWHVIELRETRTKDRPELQDVREELVSELRQKVFDDHVAELERKADVARNGSGDVDPTLINRPDLLEN